MNSLFEMNLSFSTLYYIVSFVHNRKRNTIFSFSNYFSASCDKMKTVRLWI